MAPSVNKMKKALTDQNNYTLVGNDTVIRSSQNRDLSLASSVPDYANFKQGSILNSTKAFTPTVVKTSHRTPSYLTPIQQSSQNTMFK